MDEITAVVNSGQFRLPGTPRDALPLSAAFGESGLRTPRTPGLGLATVPAGQFAVGTHAGPGRAQTRPCPAPRFP